MGWHPIQGGVEILLVATETGVKHRPNGPLGSLTDFTFFCNVAMVSKLRDLQNGFLNYLTQSSKTEF